MGACVQVWLQKSRPCGPFFLHLALEFSVTGAEHGALDLAAGRQRVTSNANEDISESIHNLIQHLHHCLGYQMFHRGIKR